MAGSSGATPSINVCNAFWRGVEGTPKGRRAKRIPVNSEALEALRAQRREHFRGLYVFCDDQGKPLKGHAVYKALARACKKLGISHRRAVHKLRHSTGAHLTMAGVPIRAVQELLRHQDIKTTECYAHLSDGFRVSAMGSLVQSQEAARKSASVEAQEASNNLVKLNG